MSQWCVSIAAVEDDAAAERGLELGRGHVPGVGLEGLERVDPGLDHGRDEREEAAAAVHHDLEAEVVAQRGQAGQVGLEEAAEEGLADDRAVLRAEVVADEEDIDRVGRRLEDAQADVWK